MSSRRYSKSSRRYSKSSSRYSKSSRRYSRSYRRKEERKEGRKGMVDTKQKFIIPNKALQCDS